MVKLILAIADIHIPNFRGIEDYTEKLENLVLNLKENAEGYSYEEIRILLLGDLIHNKNNVSNELMSLASSLISELEKIGKVIVIAGNHDLVLTNKSRLDTINTIFQVASFKNSILLDRKLSYDSGCMEDENIVWCLYSIYNDYSQINMKEVRSMYPNKLHIGLFHGNLIGSTLSNGYKSEKGISTELFRGCDLVLCGDIHKRQVIKKHKYDIVYCGSTFQQNFGETVNEHGYVKMIVNEDNTFQYSFVDVNVDFGMYNIEINSIDDIEKGEEKIKNL